jgi:hypothetical protein
LVPQAVVWAGNAWAARQAAMVAYMIGFKLMMIIVLDSLLQLLLSGGVRHLAAICRGR